MSEYIFYYLVIGIVIQTILDYPLGANRRFIWFFWPLTLVILIKLFIMCIIDEIKAKKFKEETDDSN